jgi:hypothetical protein
MPFFGRLFLHSSLVSDVVNFCIKMLILFSSQIITNSELPEAGQNIFVDHP